MSIDVTRVLGAAPAVQAVSWTERDVLLYHLSLGAGADPASPDGLRWVYERDVRVLPTFALVAGGGISSGASPVPATRLPSLGIDPATLLQAGENLVVHRPLGSAGRAVVTSRVTDVWDRGTAAVVAMESTARSVDGRPWWSNYITIWAPGAGGFGGAPMPRDDWETPVRDADRVILRTTRSDQALLYRLNGGMNPMHVDPVVARSVGLERPTLHGRATYGIACLAVVEEFLDGDVEALESLSVRFAGPMLPGDSLRISFWCEGDEVFFSAVCPERGDRAVLTNGRARLRRGRRPRT